MGMATLLKGLMAVSDLREPPEVAGKIAKSLRGFSKHHLLSNCKRVLIPRSP
jgi:hypothetical protein